MDWLTFIVEMLKASAWPLAVVVIALIFRQQLRALLARISKGRLGPAEFEFEQELQVLAAQLAKPGAAISARATAAVIPAVGSARNEILAAWRELEHAAQTLAGAGMQQLAAQDITLYQQLGALRDQASFGVHFRPSAESASAYVQLAHSLRARIEQVARSQAG